MKRTILFALFICLLSTTATSQKVLKTHSGQRILLIDNGSWRLLSPLELTSKEKPKKDGSTNLDAFDSPAKGKYAISVEQRGELETLLKNLMSDETQMCVNLEMSRRSLASIEDEVKTAKKEKIDSKELKQKFDQAKEQFKNEEANYDSIGELIKSTKKILNGREKNPSNTIVSIKEKYNSLETTNTGMGGSVTVPSGSGHGSAEVEIEKKYPTMFKLNKGYDSNPLNDCELVFDGYDSAIGQNRKEVKTQPFFSFTQEKMKPYFKNEDYLNCEANISKVGKRYYLTLNIRIRSKEAAKSYGVLRVNENIKIEMINGVRVYGRNINNDKGRIESYTGHTLYKGVYELSKDDVNDLKKSFLDHVGIIWSSGYEEYAVYNVDFLQNQLECLTK